MLNWAMFLIIEWFIGLTAVNWTTSDLLYFRSKIKINELKFQFFRVFEANYFKRIC